MNWKPSTGLKLAEPIVHQLDTEAAHTGTHLTPVFRYRMTQLIAEAIDDAVAQMQMDLVPEPPLAPMPDPRWEREGPVPAELLPTLTPREDHTEPLVVISNGADPIPEPKKKRGRPKGSTKKARATKAKRSKDAPAEAAPADPPVEAAP